MDWRNTEIKPRNIRHLVISVKFNVLKECRCNVNKTPKKQYLLEIAEMTLGNTGNRTQNGADQMNAQYIRCREEMTTTGTRESRAYCADRIT
jgi:hypothetical protein